MARHFHEDLRSLTGRLTVMGELVESRVRDAMTALLQRQPDLGGQGGHRRCGGQRTRARSRRLVHQVSRAAESRRVRPRLVRSMIKVNTDLERVGDQAVNIAQGVIHLLAWPLLRPAFDVARLGEIAVAMLDDSLKSFVEQDVAWRSRCSDATTRPIAARRPVPRPPHPHDVGPGRHRTRSGAHPRQPLPRTHRRPCDQYRRRGHLRGRGPSRSSRRRIDQPGRSPAVTGVTFRLSGAAAGVWGTVSPPVIYAKITFIDATNALNLILIC